ncbi:MAG TPA: hypothetical protein DCP63_09490 [Bacteroidetes bacterium]|nr:hypothetical protein [Bacteroidota bacterium]
MSPFRSCLDFLEISPFQEQVHGPQYSSLGMPKKETRVLLILDPSLCDHDFLREYVTPQPKIF